MGKSNSSDNALGLILVLLYLIYKGLAALVMLPVRCFSHRSRSRHDIDMPAPAPTPAPAPMPVQKNKRCNYCMSEIEPNATSCPNCNSKSFSPIDAVSA